MSCSGEPRRTASFKTSVLTADGAHPTFVVECVFEVRTPWIAWRKAHRDQAIGWSHSRWGTVEATDWCCAPQGLGVEIAEDEGIRTQSMFDFDTQPKIRVTNVINRWLQLLDNR